ncbi:MAG TPA: bifunctional phosphoribosylaminoimidazolecarboxamide formyltransferase/IMP cyclohydrolase [Bacteroidales bacterium]|nr:bifunctional phosphoribosylaminoimidazolecarboxamide formyltransferase/IMP cyclohydrolase [Bacteroidales bacterium]
MENLKKIKHALISVYHKNNLEPIVKKLNSLGITIYSTGGTYDFIKQLGIDAITVESLTSYPSILGGRVKTLHPKVFGGILARRDNIGDIEQLEKYQLPPIDLVIVDLYPFEETVASNSSEDEIIEKIDIGGISLIRAAAKNFKDVVIIPSVKQYSHLQKLLEENKGMTSLNERKAFAREAFLVSSHYDSCIYNYFNKGEEKTFVQHITSSKILRYGENPHQQGIFYGDLNQLFTQLNGKEISYNNLLDIDAAVNLISEFKEPTFAVIKHNNACGLACRKSLVEAWKDSLAGDPISAFGGVLVTNTPIDINTAEEVNKLFFEIIIAPSFEKNTLDILKIKKNRIILQYNFPRLPKQQFRSILNGVLEQEKDLKIEKLEEMKVVSNKQPDDLQKKDMLFANIIVKHTKSNAIVLAKNGQLIGSGTGQTSRVDALKQAIEKAKNFGFDLNGAVMASDAFFPFPDCVEIAHQAGIKAVIQPGGSINDQASIDYCNKHEIAMMVTGTRHFKH